MLVPETLRACTPGVALLTAGASASLGEVLLPRDGRTYAAATSAAAQTRPLEWKGKAVSKCLQLFGVALHRKERSTSNGSPGTTPTPPPVSGLQTEEGTTTRLAAGSTETPAGFDPSMMEKFFSFMSFYEQHQQLVPAQSNNSNNNNVTPMSLDGSSYARGIQQQQQQPTFAPYEPQRGSVSFMPQPQSAPGQERALDALQVQSQFAHVLKLQMTKPFDGKDFFTWSFEFELMMEGAQILGFFDGSLPYPTNGTQYEKQQYTYQSMMAYTILRRNITPTQQQNIRTYRGYGNSAELAYNHLKNLYQATDSVNQSRLMAQLTTIEMKPGEKGMAYISRCRELRDKLLRCGGSISEDAFVTVVIGGLGPHWRSTRAILRAHGRISEVALCAEIHDEQQDMDLQEERHKKKTLAPEFAFHTQRRYNSNNNRQQQQVKTFKLYHGKGGLYIGRAALKNNVFVLDFVPDLGTADSDAIVNFADWTHPPDLNPDFSLGGFWYSHTIPEAERTRALATIQQTAAAETTSPAAETTSAVAETTSAAAEATLAAAETSSAAAGPTTPVNVDKEPPTPAQQLNPTQREVHRSANFVASFYSNSDAYQRSPGHRAPEDIWHARTGHPSNTVLNNTIRAGVLDKDSLLLPDGREHQRARGTCHIYPEADLPHQPFSSHHNPSAPAYAPLEKVYSDILFNRELGQVTYNYTITFIDAATRYVWHRNLPSRDMALAAFAAWLPVAERESGTQLQSFQSDGGGEYTSQPFKQYLAERGIKQLLSLPYAHQQQGVAERMNRTLQNSVRKLLRGMRLPNHQWPAAMDHAVMLHNLLSSSSLPNNASPHLLWTGKQGSTKMLRVFGCMVQYRPPEARAGRFSQRAQWGLHIGIEKNYNAWKIFDVHSKETVAARDVIYERLTLQTYLTNLHENQDPTGGFRGDRAFASAADEADWDEQNVDNASKEAGPLPFCSVDVPMDEENPRDSVNAEVFYHFADNGYVTPARVNTNEAERIGPNFSPDPEAGDEAAYPEDPTLPRYSQTGLQILGLVTAVHGNALPKEPATVQQALGGEHREKWREAMDRELKALEERNTWKVVPASVARNKTILTGKWVFHIKTKADGTIEKFKARWVVRGFDQEQGRDFIETFAPVSRHTSLRILLAIAAMKKKKLRQIDVANAFLYAPVDAEIFVELPHGTHGNSNQVCQLLKSLYRIKQAPRLWQQHLHTRLTRIGFRQLPHGQGMYRLTKDADYILLIVYVDDLLYIGSTDDVTTWFEGELQKDLMLTVSSTVTQYLGLNIREEENAIYLSAEKYADTIAKRFSLTPTAIAMPYRYTAGSDKGNSAPLKAAGIRDYQRKLGCLLFAAVTCRPDLSYSASQLATYLKKPKAEHLAKLDRALHYFVSTPTIGLTYYKGKATSTKLISYVDADHAGDSDN
ncbi:unnamed protein product [Closterium sp. NIES-53]